MSNRVYNFSAGPSALPLEVLETIQKNLVNYNNSGLSVLEMSHRTPIYEEIHNGFKAILKDLLNISDNYDILLLQGGASTQFDAIPLNLLNGGSADYAITGNFASKAYQAAKHLSDNVNIATSSEDNNFTLIKDFSTWTINPNANYLHLTSNNTIYGLTYYSFPKTQVPLVVDMSSNIASMEMDLNQFSLIYAGAQKNLGAAGLTVVIIKKDLIGKASKNCPIMLDYKTQAENESLYNTPPAFAIYTAFENMKWLKQQGGVSAIEKINKQKAKLLYDFIDNSTLYKNPVDVKNRSIMNIPFTTPTKDLDALFVQQAKENGIISIKGHKKVGGMRASIYNGMPIEGVGHLINFMKEFERSYKNHV